MVHIRYWNIDFGAKINEVRNCKHINKILDINTY